MTAKELRQMYVNFFKERGHKEIASASLLPENDPTVLFTMAGMHPLVPYLLGEKHPSGKRLTDVQKCVRTEDIDEVGDDTHCTFFEMLGNWSLGDYFKQEAISMSFEFLTKYLNIPVERLAVTAFEGDEIAPADEETVEIWQRCISAPLSSLYKADYFRELDTEEFTANAKLLFDRQVKHSFRTLDVLKKL